VTQTNVSFATLQTQNPFVDIEKDDVNICVLFHRQMNWKKKLVWINY